MNSIDVANLRKIYRSEKGERHVLENVNLSVAEGEFVAIVGYTGSGKTTLLKVLAGLETADAGRVTIGGQVVTGFPRDTSIVFQNYSLLPWLSALENVRLAVEAAQPEWGRKRQQEQAERYLQMVNLGGALTKRPGQLSGGMRQRVAIARAFATEPSVLLLDEPFGALDALTRGNLQQELARLCFTLERAVTTVMITNSVDEAVLLADRILPMTKGPKATLGPGIAVELSRPRDASTLAADPQALAIHAKVVEYLTGFGSAERVESRRESRKVASTVAAEVEA